MYTIWSVLFAITDFWLILLPARTIWLLQIPKATRIGIIFILSLGLLATAAACVKAITVWTAYKTYDPTWRTLPVLMSSHIELSLGLIAASLPALNPYLLKILPRRLLALRSFADTGGKVKKQISSWTSSLTTNDRTSDDERYSLDEKLTRQPFRIERVTVVDQDSKSTNSDGHEQLTTTVWAGTDPPQHSRISTGYGIHDISGL
jgi:hypothetical protein